MKEIMFMRYLRKTWPAVALAISMAFIGAPTLAQEYPMKPVRLIVGFAPGGPVDSTARIIAANLQQQMGQPFVVENKAGANAMIAAEYVKNAPPDGYTVFVSSSSAITLNPTLYKSRVRYSPPDDFAPVANIIAMPLILMVNDTDAEMKGVKSVGDIVTKAKSQPGKLAYGSAGNGNITHLAFELMQQRAAIQMIHIPYPGTAPAQAAILGKQVAMVFDSMNGIAHVKSGTLRPLAISANRRIDALPDVPTMQELGFVDFDIKSWVGIFVPKGTPSAVVERLSKGIAEAMKDPSVREKLLLQGPLMYLPPAEFGAMVKNETAQLAEIVDKAKIKID
jgi:tripartite-type tricarboxylate transporter receptor subunit TctC